MSVRMGSNELLERVEQALADYNPRHIDHPAASPAAVLILIQDCAGEAHVVFTERTEHVENHKGQMCFPGGACDDTDDDCQSTALRETWEEIGVQTAHVRIIGQLDDMLTVSNFRVTPYVGRLEAEAEPEAEYPFSINDHEVKCVVQVPLNWLLEDGNMELEVRKHQGREVLVPAFSYNGHRIWGATARMLHQLLELLR